MQDNQKLQELAKVHDTIKVQEPPKVQEVPKVQSISKSMLMLALTVEHALMPVLQKLFTQLNNFIHINPKAAASAADRGLLPGDLGHHVRLPAREAL